VVSIVLPVPGLPATNTVKPLGIPPSISASKLAIPVEMRSNVMSNGYWVSNIRFFYIIGRTHQLSVFRFSN
jgi:hypothetical protein